MVGTAAQPNDDEEPDDKTSKEQAKKEAEPVEAEDAEKQKSLQDEYIRLQESDPELFQARLALDQARLRFYSLPQEAREKLFETDLERKRNAKAQAPEEQVSAAEQREKEAQKAREQALEAARNARSEGERAVAEEQARLLDVASAQAKFDAQLVAKTEELKGIEDARLALRRRVQESLANVDDAPPPADAANSAYEEIRATLGATRDALARSLRALNSGKSDVPSPGADGLDGLPEQIDRSDATSMRKKVLATETDLQARERELRVASANAHFSDMDALNDLRLRLVPFLSDQKRKSVTGLGPNGLEQAYSEARHVFLLLSYHHNATRRWLDEITRPSDARGKSALAAALILFKWLFPIGIFIWWRRRADRVLGWLEEKIREETEENQPRGTTHRAIHAVQLLRRIRRPLEWLLLIWTIFWFLPTEAKTLVEVELVRTIFTWTLGGTISVVAIDFIADIEGPRHRRKSVLMTAHLRLRSLRLVGRAIVIFGLIHSLSSLTVGQGTIYGWVFSFLWLAALVITLVLIKWWRHVIFERISAKRKKTRLDTWIAAHQTGWQSFVAAVSGGATLFGGGAYRALRAQISAFSVTRQILAYLFQRDMSKQAEDAPDDECRSLDRRRFKALSPTKHSDGLVPSVADTQVGEIVDRINAPGGGVFAIVGERGSGKTTLIKRIASQTDDIVRVQTPFGDMEEFEAELLEALTDQRTGDVEQVVRDFDGKRRDGGILIDNAHRLIKPRVGGFDSFDRILSMARSCSKNIAWLFAFDEVIWRLLERMRGSKPLFDEVIRIAPWQEEGIVAFLTARNDDAGVDPSFADLVGELPDDADEIDYDEALAATEENYLRLLWHYSAGNPGIALHAWRMSLGIAEDGEIKVRVFQAPSPSALEELPDSALFVLRAIVQLERAQIEEICKVTQLPATAVQDVIRYGRVKGYIYDWDEGIGISWTWFRAVTKLLQRRHFLYSA